MKSESCLLRLVFVAVTAMLLTGCLLKRAPDSTRHFVLSPISRDEPAPTATKHLSIGIGFVKMPSYLLRNSVAVRTGANEIEYLEDARWAERLDQCFQRTLAANLSRLLSSDGVQMSTRVFITVQQFDVDRQGRGALIAQWRIAALDSDEPLKSGEARLARTGPSPHGNGAVIATTLSDLAGEFSRELAQSICESVKASP
jgi:uncharacterized lipoprotein YmbA